MAKAPDSAVERAYEAIREGVVLGSLGPGSWLRLADLSNSLGVSHVPVREALRLLEAEGLVQIAPNRGAFVTALSLPEMEDLYRARVITETAAVRLATPSLTSEQIEQARDLVDHLVDLLTRGRIREAAVTHRRVHSALIEGAQSPWLERMIKMLWDNSDRYLRYSAALRPSPIGFGDEHRRIIDAVSSRDPDAAAAALADHLNHTAALVGDFLRSEQTQQPQVLVTAPPRAWHEYAAPGSPQGRDAVRPRLRRSRPRRLNA